jgi:hypothetical protein
MLVRGSDMPPGLCPTLGKLIWFHFAILIIILNFLLQQFYCILATSPLFLGSTSCALEFGGCLGKSILFSCFMTRAFSDGFLVIQSLLHIIPVPSDCRLAHPYWANSFSILPFTDGAFHSSSWSSDKSSSTAMCQITSSNLDWLQNCIAGLIVSYIHPDIFLSLTCAKKCLNFTFGFFR